MTFKVNTGKVSSDVCNRLVKQSSKIRTLIYKSEFEFGLEAFAIRFVAADSGVYLTSGAINVTVCKSEQ